MPQPKFLNSLRLNRENELWQLVQVSLPATQAYVLKKLDNIDMLNVSSKSYIVVLHAASSVKNQALLPRSINGRKYTDRFFSGFVVLVIKYLCNGKCLAILMGIALGRSNLL